MWYNGTAWNLIIFLYEILEIMTRKYQLCEILHIYEEFVLSAQF